MTVVRRCFSAVESRLARSYGRLPDAVQPLAKHGYYLLHPLRSWRKIRKVDRTTAAFVDRYFESDDEFEAYSREFFEGRIVDVCREASAAVGDDHSIYDAHRDECRKLYALVRKLEPDTVVETGVYHGVSTTSMLLALDENGAGTLHSIDASPLPDAPDRSGAKRERRRPSCAERGTQTLPQGREPGWIVPEDLRDRWELTVGRPRRELPPLLADLGGVDLFFHDSEHSASGMLFEFVLAWEWLAPGGVILSCHVDWNDAFDTFVAEYPAEPGRASFEYSGREGYPEPCTCAYALKPSEPPAPGDVTGDRGESHG